MGGATRAGGEAERAMSTAQQTLTTAKPCLRPIALRAAADAEKNVGTTEEGGNNRGQAVEVYLRSVGLAPGNPWCAAMVYYRLAMAAVWERGELPAHVPRSGYTPNWKTWALTQGLWLPRSVVVASGHGGAVVSGTLPRRGDLALFYFASKRRIAHIGIVVKVGENGVYTVEGNTGPDPANGVNRDGDGVYRRFRPWASLGRFGGFARLNF